LDVRGEYGDTFIKYHEHNFVSDIWNLKIEAAFMQERLIDEERIKHNEIRPVRMAPNYQYIGFKSFEAWHVGERSVKKPEDETKKWHNLVRVSEVPEVRAASLEIPAEAKDNRPRMQDLIDPFIEAKSWGRDKTKEAAIPHLGLIARLLDNPRSVDITGRDVVTFVHDILQK
jgi:hypothetical protein